MAKKTHRRKKGDRGIIRVFRHGLGDCILICLKKQDSSEYKILIDCGVAVATKDSKNMMTNVVQDVLERTGRKIDVLVVTHQHWDHVSGFTQASDLFKKLEVGEVWLAWTEDQNDPLAKDLREKHSAALAALDKSVAALALAGQSGRAEEIQLTLGMQGASGEKTSTAFEFAKALSRKKALRYWRPTASEKVAGQQTEPLKLKDPDVTIYALGPPHDNKLLRKTLPSKTNPETFELAVDGSGILSLDVISALDGIQDNPPFAPIVTIPFEVARGETFFQNHYWGVLEEKQDWRRIDSDWLGAADTLALAMQAATNNTSLVLAIEFSDGDVLLFVGDAQVGNWLSWVDLGWKIGQRTVKAADLLDRTIFYKVGHHGSHNATLREKGLDLMTRLETAVIPVDQEVARKMKWGAMPLASLIEALEKKPCRVLRTDIPPTKAMQGIAVTELYYEISL